VRRLAPLAALLLGLLLLLPTAAFAVTDEDLANLDTTGGPEVAPRLATGAGTGGLRVLLGLLVVVAVIFGVWWLLKRTNRSRVPGASRNGVVTVLSTTSVGPNRNLHLVRVGEDVILLGSTEQGISALHSMDHESARDHGLLEGVEPAELVAVRPLADIASAVKPARGGMLDGLRKRTART
jgi:flagellar protein FliO/FliZ